MTSVYSQGTVHYLIPWVLPSRKRYCLLDLAKKKTAAMVQSASFLNTPSLHPGVLLRFLAYEAIGLSWFKVLMAPS